MFAGIGSSPSGISREATTSIRSLERLSMIYMTRRRSIRTPDVLGGANIKVTSHRASRLEAIPDHRKSSSDPMNSGGMGPPDIPLWVQSRTLVGAQMSCRFKRRFQCRSSFGPPPVPMGRLGISTASMLPTKARCGLRSRREGCDKRRHNFFLKRLS